MFRFVWICSIVGLLAVGGVRANLGLNQVIPNLDQKVQTAIGSGVGPLVKVNGTITIDPKLDSSGVLSAIVTVTNVVNASIGEVFTVTANAVGDSVGPPNSVFSHVFKANINAEIDMQNAITGATPMKAVLRKAAYKAIESNLTGIQNQIRNLTSVYTELGAAANTLTLFPNQTKNISTEITPKLVDKLVAVLGDISSKISNLASLFPNIIKIQISTVGYISVANSTANSTVSNVSTQINLFNNSISAIITNLTRTAETFAINVSQAYVPITSAAKNFNGGDISNLTVFLSQINVYNVELVNNITLSMEDLQDYIAQRLVNETGDSTSTVFNGIKNLTDSALLAVSNFTTECSNKYQSQLKQTLLQVNRLGANCLMSENSTLPSFYTVLATLLEPVRSDAAGINASQILDCSNDRGACSLTYFSVFPELAAETHTQLQLIHNAIEFKIQMLALRVGTCAEAVTADVQEIVQKIIAGFVRCLETGN